MRHHNSSPPVRCSLNIEGSMMRNSVKGNSVTQHSIMRNRHLQATMIFQQKVSQAQLPPYCRILSWQSRKLQQIRPFPDCCIPPAPHVHLCRHHPVPFSQSFDALPNLYTCSWAAEDGWLHHVAIQQAGVCYLHCFWLPAFSVAVLCM